MQKQPSNDTSSKVGVDASSEATQPGREEEEEEEIKFEKNKIKNRRIRRRRSEDSSSAGFIGTQIILFILSQFCFRRQLNLSINKVNRQTHFNYKTSRNLV
ncbi:hypothetical protein T03_6906 [Trichinella britovi]|uniref:Uncharacterized protein n=1 Tax=Trichinella britovi TaxID=45882 RepID=A0A0V1DB85_TRIBR|nr:hypothetical protein T03_6906 [Trichinella britovi]